MNQQLTLAIHLNVEATFADFCFENNALLKQQLQNIVHGSGDRLMVLWGKSGSGKSHLLQACCHAMTAHQPAIYLPLTTLLEWGPDVLDGVDEQALVCIDDIDAIAAHAEWEEALFHLFNRIRDNERTALIMSASMPPAQIPLLLPDLQSRLAWGLVIQLNELCDQDKIKTLQWHAQKRGFECPWAVGHFLLKRCSRNMHDLQVILNRLDKASLMAQRKITIPFVKHVLDI